MRYSHRHFVRGRITDGDSTDIQGDSLLECVNLELDAGIGQAYVRPPLSLYEGIGASESIPSVYGYVIYDVCKWDSGINPVKHNTMLIFRKRTANVWEDFYTIYSNAPDGGDLGTATQWTLLESGIATAHCRPTAINGAVRVAMGPSLHSMIHTYVLDAGSPRTYPSSISIATTTTRDDGYGTGGKIFNGWTWDHRRLYVPTNITCASAVTTSASPLPPGSWRAACIPIWDEDTPQYGGAVTINGDYIEEYQPIVSPIQAITFTFSVSVDGKWPKRISGVAIYLQRYDDPNGENDTDWLRVKTVKFDASFTTTVTITSLEYDNIEGVWSADGQRAMPKTKEQAEDDIDVLCCGFVHRRKRLYAWGIKGDAGQSQFAVSVKDNIQTSQIDVFPKLNRIWVEGSRATVYALEWADRLFQVTATNSHLIDLEQRIDDQTMKLGTGTGTTYLRTIAVAPDGGVFFANKDSIWLYRTGLDDLAYNVWKKEWQLIPEEYKENAVAGWNRERSEYWLCVRLSEYHWRVFVYCADVRARMWKTYLFHVSSTPNPLAVLTVDGAFDNEFPSVSEWTNTFEPLGFFHDEEGRWILYGMDLLPSPAVARFFEFTESEGLAFTETPIYYSLASQWQGVRADENVLEYMDIQRSRIFPLSTSPTLSENHLLCASLFVNRNTHERTSADGLSTITVDAPAHLAILRFDRRQAARLKSIRGNEYRFEVRGKWDNDGSARPSIYEITVDTSDHRKRTR